MSRKHFTLIKGEKIHFAPGKKILKADEFSKSLTAKELIDTVKDDAIEFKKSVVEEAEKQKEEAQKEGFQQGLEKWASIQAEFEEEIERVHQKISETVIPVALKAAKKIIGRELELSKEAVVDIVINNLKAVAHHKKIKIYISREDAPILAKNKERLKGVFEKLESLMLIESDDVKPGGAVIETEGGIINAQLDNLIRTLEKAFESISK
jgi:type III secretion protein L